ncbi:MAG TPA: DUF2142 domain-containing protein [Actinomycetota bacterium]|nr:DUF2142 domain-containing protein [Actinomycetota bacterium]
MDDLPQPRAHAWGRRGAGSPGRNSQSSGRSLRRPGSGIALSGPAGPSVRPSGPDARPAVGVFLAFFVLSACWALATPLFSAPDERSHAIKAAGTVRGQLWGEEVEGTSITMMRVPAWLDPAVGARNCRPYRPGADALCLPDELSRTEIRDVPARAGRYPPLYYLLAGAPTYLTDPATAIYLIRLLSAALAAIFLTVAFGYARRLREAPALPVGFVVAATPMVFYLAGSVNPNGLEVAAAICLWVVGTALVVAGLPADRPAARRLLVWLALAAVTLALNRSASPAFAAITLGTLVLFADRRRLVRLARDHRVLKVVGLIGAAGVVAAVMVLMSDPYPGPVEVVDPRGFQARFLRALSRQDDYAQQMVAVFGSLDTKPAWPVFGVWFAAAAGLVSAAIRSGRRFVVVGLLVGGTVLLSTVVEAMALGTMGVFWQGRYSLPLAVGVPILASACIGRGSRAFDLLTRRGAAIGVPLVAGAIQLVCLVAAARRFSGGGASWSFLWQQPSPISPVGLPLVLWAFLLAQIFLGTLIARGMMAAREG